MPGLAWPWLSRDATSVLRERFGEALKAPGLLARAIGEHRQRPGRGRCLQRAEQVRELDAPCSCRDQRVIARQRADLDVDLVTLAAPRAQRSSSV